MRRRTFLASSVVLTGALAGCPGRPSGSRTETVETDRSTDSAATGSTRPGCAAVPLPRPTPDPGEPDRDPYPPFPADLTRETASSFAADFERAYRRNAALASSDSVDLVDVRRTVTATLEAADGYAVAIEGTEVVVQNRETDADGTPIPGSGSVGDRRFAVWYEVTPDRVGRVRAGVELTPVEREEPPSFRDARTVLCP